MTLDQIENIFSSINFAAIFFSFVFLIYWGYVFVIIYHLVRFGVGPKPKLFAMIFLAGAVILFTTALYTYARVDFTNLLGNLGSFKPELNIPSSNY